MTVNTSGRAGKLKKTVEVWTNDPANRLVVLSIAGEVVLAEQKDPAPSSSCSEQ
jgi:hypothetical protein